MKITSIKQQLKRHDRYSIYVDGEYAFSLSENGLLQSGLASGRSLTAEDLAAFKALSADDKIYGQALRYAAMRPRTIWEMQLYLQRKDASPPLLETILNKLSIVGLLDDKKYAEMFASDRRLLKPTSLRMLQLELRKKHISSDIIAAVVEGEANNERDALAKIITTKRRQSKYQDDTKLMQFLARQGFRYGDIVDALREEPDD